MGTAIVSVTPPSGPGKTGEFRFIAVQTLVDGSYSYIVLAAFELCHIKIFPVTGSTLKMAPAPTCGIPGVKGVFATLVKLASLFILHIVVEVCPTKRMHWQRALYRD